MALLINCIINPMNWPTCGPLLLQNMGKYFVTRGKQCHTLSISLMLAIYKHVKLSLEHLQHLFMELSITCNNFIEFTHLNTLRQNMNLLVPCNKQLPTFTATGCSPATALPSSFRETSAILFSHCLMAA